MRVGRELALLTLLVGREIVLPGLSHIFGGEVEEGGIRHYEPMNIQSGDFCFRKETELGEQFD